ncbi:tripartite motif-containing protein 10 [Sus scrofa]|uniref:Tripartite motif-containing protein 10 n=2 Tax=Sus scrofa TaxID=9823 RepID=TRI10_PIG|nr:tripartite motif-containing protein 10 [Sus scrofa]O19085.2 RecName: Full=Tripartite motif-containing protein 10; AltName: Full=B30-RING finger protein; AltName: Full=RING finger protein 9 [Sus scrofa]CAB63932.1 putative ring finger protein B30 [Sus scrofa]BAG82684.1 tripartite motif-containing protein 10 [Sus scrofa]BAG82690.1 tripartite motif-containing protein 10 [Sus scrofa]BAG82706.1 tripartite motif-containing protein 10 [Sus scrofa]
MASAASVSSLADEVNCPICQGTLREPVTIDCGHNFCCVCLTRYLEIPCLDPGELPTCPLCKEPFRPGSFRPNWQLASVVENIERLKLGSQLGSEEEEDVCLEHREKVYYFCEDDEMQLCVVCREAWEHRHHTVRFLEDAAGPYREQIQKCLECLRKEGEEIQRIQLRENQRIQVLLTQVATKKQKVISEFAHLSQFLEEQQSVLLAQLERLDGDILKHRDEFDVLVAGEICRFNTLIEELEEKNQRPARDLLTDIRSTLIRCETRRCRKPEAVSPELGQRIRDFPQQALPLRREMKTFLEKLCFELDYEPAHISLDPQTSHPKLLLSEDNQQARFSYKWQNSPDNPQRFDRATCVLAHSGFTEGRHTWVVSVDLAHGGSCTVGVVSQDIRRKGELRMRPEEGVWAVRLAWGFVSALGSFPTRLALEEHPRQVRVSIDYEVGWVTFVNAVTQEPIYTFTASFTQKVFPFFGLWGRGSKFSLSS